MNRTLLSTSALTEAKLVVCCGAGGVGKTSSAAALGMSAAQLGRRVVVITIDPAKRLAQALGVGLGNDPTKIHLAGLTPGGSLHALMLDPKATFDAMVARTIKQEALRRALQDNRLYRVLTQAFAGMQELMAVERLLALLEHPDFDLVVLDTPPTTNVLQFFDTPERVSRFFDRRIVRWFLPDTEGGRWRRLLSAQSAAMLLVGKVAGEDFARDLQEFFGAMGSVSDGMSSRAASLQQTLLLASTRYVVVTGPEQSRIDETLSIVEQLQSRRYAPAAVIVNRVTPEHLVEENALECTDAGLFGLLDTLNAQRRALLDRARMERGQIERLRAGLGETPIQVVPRFDVTLDSADGLHFLARALA